MRHLFCSSRILRTSVLAFTLLALTSCGEIPAEPDRSPPAGLGIAAMANPASNGQIHMAFPPDIAGFSIVSFPEACILFQPGGAEPEPDSWVRATLEDIVTKEHLVVQDGILLAGSFFTGLQIGQGHGVLNAHFDREGSFKGASLKINGTLDEGGKVNCSLNVDRDFNAKGFIKVTP